MDRRRVANEPFLFCVAIEARDRAQPAGDGRSSPPAGLQLPPETFDVHAVYLEEAALVVPAPDSELSQVERVRVAGGTSVARQEPSERQFLAIGETPIDRDHRG